MGVQRLQLSRKFMILQVCDLLQVFIYFAATYSVVIQHRVVQYFEQAHPPPRATAAANRHAVHSWQSLIALTYSPNLGVQVTPWFTFALGLGGIIIRIGRIILAAFLYAALTRIHHNLWKTYPTNDEAIVSGLLVRYKCCSLLSHASLTI